MMRYLKISVLLLVVLLNGCSIASGSKLFAPERFGMIRIAPAVYVEAGMGDAARADLLREQQAAVQMIRAAYGSVGASPIIHSCFTEACYEGFGGGHGSKAKVYYDRILLSPRGLNRYYLAHEWSHAELNVRLSPRAWLSLPAWFDEGLAVAISQAPEHSEQHWQFLIDENVPRPTPAELHQLKSSREWLAAVKRYGATGNLERKARGEPEIRPVYTAAGHEVRPWLASAGTPGLLSLIRRMNAGETFDEVYPAP